MIALLVSSVVSLTIAVVWCCGTVKIVELTRVTRVESGKRGFLMVSSLVVAYVVVMSIRRLRIVWTVALVGLKVVGSCSLGT